MTHKTYNILTDDIYSFPFNTRARTLFKRMQLKNINELLLVYDIIHKVIGCGIKTKKHIGEELFKLGIDVQKTLQ